MSSARFTPLADLLRRLCAAGCAALVLALTIFAASPGAHDSLHADGTARTDDGCAVVLFAGGVARRLPADIVRRAVVRLAQLDAAVRIEDLREPPSNRLEALVGNRDGQWSIRINGQWRLCFRFEAGDAFDVEIVDYH